MFVLGSEVYSADRIAALITEQGVRTLTALTRADAGRLLTSRNIAAVVLDPDLPRDEADLLEKVVSELRPGTPVVRPITAESCPGEVVEVMRRIAG